MDFDKFLSLFLCSLLGRLLQRSAAEMKEKALVGLSVVLLLPRLTHCNELHEKGLGKTRLLPLCAHVALAWF